MNLEEVLRCGYEAGASDIHLMSGRPVMFRTNGEMDVYNNEEIQKAELEELFSVLFTKTQKRKLEQIGEIETAVTLFDRFRIRINAFFQQEFFAVVMRLLMLEIPKPKDIFFPSEVLELLKEKKGLILIAGESGCGKTTTAASLLNYIGQNERKHIVTIENPIEYLLCQGKGMVFQREIQTDDDAYADIYADAIKAAVRQDADVIFIGTLKGASAISEAILAAETGHLVIAVLHTGCAADTLQWLTDSFLNYRREEIQRRLSNVLKGIVAQKLLPIQKEGGRRGIFEVMTVNKEVQMLIREGRMSQVSAVMEKNRESGMQTMDDAVLSAYMNSVISGKAAVDYAFDKEKMRRHMKIY